MGASDDDVPTRAADTVDTRGEKKNKRQNEKTGRSWCSFQENKALGAAHCIGDGLANSISSLSFFLNFCIIIEARMSKKKKSKAHEANHELTGSSVLRVFWFRFNLCVGTLAASTEKEKNKKLGGIFQYYLFLGIIFLFSLGSTLSVPSFHCSYIDLYKS